MHPAIIDTGNTLGDCISLQFAEKLRIHKDLLPGPCSRAGTARAGASLPVEGRVREPLEMILTTSQGKEIPYYIQPLVLNGLAMPINLSESFFSDRQLDLMYSRQQVRSGRHSFPLLEVRPGRPSNRCRRAEIPVLSETGIPAYTENSETEISPLEGRILQLTIKDSDAVQKIRASSTNKALFRYSPEFVDKYTLNRDLSDRSVVGYDFKDQLVDVDTDGRFEIYVINSTTNRVTVSSNSLAGRLYVADSCVRFVGSVEPPPPAPTEPWETGTESRSLSQSQRAKRASFLDKALALSDNPLLADPEQRLLVQEIFMDEWNVLSRDDNPGQTDLVEHPVYVPKGAPPVKLKNRPINPKLMEDLRRQIREWLRDGVIKESGVSPWNFPVSPVMKKNGKIRWVVDFRLLNKITRKDCYPIPNITELLTHVKGSTVFSTIDLTAAFHAIRVRKEDQEKLTFSADDRFYRFAKMPFGLTSAPNTWARLITKVLEGFPKDNVITFFDDLLLHSRSVKEHAELLRKVLGTLRKAGLRISAEKSQIFAREVDYLGHTISREGVRIPKKYTEVVENWPVPENLRQLRAFLGKVNYYRRFIASYNELANPLLKYLKAEKSEVTGKALRTSKQENARVVDLKNDPEALEAFNALRKVLTSRQVLAYPDFHSTNPFIVDTDYSGAGIGVVLSQIQDGQERAIAYGAKRLNSAQRDYSSYKGEMFAAVFGVEHFRYYLLGHKFLLRTDNNALTWLRNQQQPKGVLIRWLRILSTYDFNIVHRPGKQHQNADSLSRAEHAPELTKAETEELQLDECIATLRQPTGSDDNAELRHQQAIDPVISRVLQWVKSQHKPEGQEFKILSPELKFYVNHMEQLFVDRRGILMKLADPYADEERPLVCLPEALQATAIESLHAVAHMGETATTRAVMARFFFPRITTVVKEHVAYCLRCQQNRRKEPQRHTFEADSTGYPGEKICIDFVGPLTLSENGNRYLFTILDTFTKWFTAYPCQDQKSNTAIDLLVHRYIPERGFPATCHSDAGPAFNAKLWGEALKRLGIRETKIPRYNPKSNSVERYHRTLTQRTKALIHELGGDWEDHLPAVLLSMRTSQHRTTGCTPFFLEHGREARLPIDIATGEANPDGLSEDTYVKHIHERFIRAYERVRERQCSYIRRQRQVYNQGHNRIVVHDLVWLWTPRARIGLSKKHQSYWTGPFRVIRKLTNVLFEVEAEGEWNTRPLLTVAAVDRLKRCKKLEYARDGPKLDLTEEDLRPLDDGAEVIHPDEDPEHGLPPLPGPSSTLPGDAGDPPDGPAGDSDEDDEAPVLPENDEAEVTPPAGPAPSTAPAEPASAPSNTPEPSGGPSSLPAIPELQEAGEDRATETASANRTGDSVTLRDSTRDPGAGGPARFRGHVPISPIDSRAPSESDLTPRVLPSSLPFAEPTATTKRGKPDSTQEAHEATFAGKTPGKRPKEADGRPKPVVIPLRKRKEFAGLAGDDDVDMDLDARASIKRTAADNSRSIPITVKHKKQKNGDCHDCLAITKSSRGVVTDCAKHCRSCVDTGKPCHRHCVGCTPSRHCQHHCTQCTSRRDCGYHRTMRKCARCTDSRPCGDHRYL